MAPEKSALFQQALDGVTLNPPFPPLRRKGGRLGADFLGMGKPIGLGGQFR